MSMITHNEAKVEFYPFIRTATLWFVKGMDSTPWPNKLVAEVAARAAFPTAFAEQGQGLVYFRNFIQED